MAEKMNEFVPLRKGTKRKSNEDIASLKPSGCRVNSSHDFSSRLSGLSAESIEKIRFENGIEVDSEDDCPAPIIKFRDSNLQQDILKALSNRSIYSPTPVQMQAIPILLSGKDLIAIAPTGSGKTFGYLIPLLSFLKSHVHRGKSIGKPSALIMTPTRELMQQILDSCKDLLQDLNVDADSLVAQDPISYQYQNGLINHTGQFLPTNEHLQTSQVVSSPSTARRLQTSTMQSLHNNDPYMHLSTNSMQMRKMEHQSQYYEKLPSNEYLTSIQNPERFTDAHYRVTGICGGIPLQNQIDVIKKGTDVIVATPGRLIDLCQRSIISLNKVRFIVLDECDKMLDMGLEDQLRKLFAIITSQDIARQTSLWSATLPDSLERLARSSVINPVTIHVGIKDTVSRNIEQNVIFLHTYQKEKKLLQTLRQTNYPPVLVFASSITLVVEITKFLKEEEFFVEELHSQLPQSDRFKIVSDFRNGFIDVLVATDLASRGLDIPEITHVINYDTPNTIEDYIHRCGRTGRFGRPGKATTFLTLECKIAEDLRFLLESTGVEVPVALQDTKQFGKKVLKTEFGDRVL